jgi:hypothetical protein
MIPTYIEIDLKPWLGAFGVEDFRTLDALYAHFKPENLKAILGPDVDLKEAQRACEQAATQWKQQREGDSGCRAGWLI